MATFSQSSLLSSGFLNTIGSGKEEGLSLKGTAKVLADIAIEFALNTRENLNRVDRVSSGALSDSIIPLPIEIFGKTVVAEISVLSYYKFIDEGVAGFQGGSGKYKFKNSKPSKTMVDSIEKWIVKEGLKARNTKVSINQRESKRLKNKISEASKQRSFAYATAFNIKKRGLKATNFWTDEIENLKKNIKEKLSKGLKIDVMVTLKQDFKDGNST